jgi:hypothetical protein
MDSKATVWQFAFCIVLALSGLLPAESIGADEGLQTRLQLYEYSVDGVTFRYRAASHQKKLIKRLNERAKQDFTEINRALPTTWKAPIDIWVVPRASDYFTKIEDREQSPVPDWAVGVAVDSDLIVLASQARPSVDEIERTFIHELVHSAVEASVDKGGIPRWFHEGIAIYFADDWSSEQSERLAQAAASNTLLDFRQLHSGFPEHHNRASVAYAQSFHLVRHFVDRFGLKTLRELFVDIAGGASFYSAFKSVTGTEFVQFEREWKAAIPKAISVWSILREDIILFIAAIALFVMVGFRVFQKRRHGDRSGSNGDAAGWDYDERAYPLPGQQDRDA